MELTLIWIGLSINKTALRFKLFLAQGPEEKLQIFYTWKYIWTNYCAISNQQMHMHVCEFSLWL